MSMKPRGAIIAIAVWTLFQLVRLMAFSITQDVSAGIDSPAWMFPALMDVFIGITAPFIAYMILRKTGLAVWTIAIVWFALSISDHLDAIITTLTVPIAHSMQSMGSSMFLVTLIINTVLDLVAIKLLAGKKMRSYYLSSR